MRIKINQISKTEGASGFEGALVDGDLARARIEVQEGARLIEGLLIGRPYSDAPIITARICGICPVIHNLTAIKALEAALGIKVSEEVEILRKLMLYAQIIHSHTLHLFFLSLPDFVKVSEFSLVKKYSKEAQVALEIRKFATELIRIIGGRTVHPINTEVGGFKRKIDIEAIKGLASRHNQVLEAAIKLARFFVKLDYPKFRRETEYISLRNKKEYAIYDGDVFTLNQKAFDNKVGSTISQDHSFDLGPVGDTFGTGFTSESEAFKPEDFIQQIKESEVDVVKRSKYQELSYMVGALARINNNYSQLNKEAKKILASTKIKLPSLNSFYNVLAQAIEVVHFIEEIGHLLENTRMNMRMFANSFANKGMSGKTRLKAGKGLAACEAPRGILFHYYELDKDGKIKACNIITPTAQFLNNLEDDLKTYIPELKSRKTKEQEKKIKQLVRAYDPCFTCATH